mgnify:CR=1 FL=1
MELFITPTSAARHAREKISGKPGWSFDVVRRTTRNPDGSVDYGFGAVLRCGDGLIRVAA